MQVLTRRTLLVLLAVLLPLGGAPAAEAVPPAGEAEVVRNPALSLAAVVDAAVQRHPEAILTAARADEARALQRRAHSLIGADPALFLRHETDRAGSDTGLDEWEAGLELPLWRWGERSAARELAEQARRGARKSAALLRLEAAGAVRESLWAVALAENALALAEADLVTARELERQVARRVAQGDLARGDLLLVRDETLQREARLQQARLRLQQAVLTYRRLTGLGALPGSFDEQPVQPPPEPEAHPALAAAAARLERSRAELAQAREASGGSPLLFLGGKRSDDGGGEPVESLQASLTLPLGGAHSDLRRSQAALSVAERQAALARTRRELEGRRQAAEQALQAARSALTLARERARLAEERGRLARRAFELGELPLAEYLRERNRMRNAVHEAARLQLELGRQIARYNQALGLTP